ncbi:MAG: hypothetical protein GH143_05260 [Calditrichaeota bacterium]|nr:hypothetical protein [Calditrichota bacterium]
MRTGLVIFLVLFFTAQNASFAQISEQSEFLAVNDTFAGKLAEHYFALGDVYLELYDSEGRKPGVFDKVIANYKEGLFLDPTNAQYEYRLGYSYHMMRRLKEASLRYDNALRLDPPRLPSQNDIDLAIKYAPRLFVHQKEYFKLEDVVAVIHPEKTVIGYHLFWDDDIDYPEDNDPIDHEVVWIEFDQKTGKVTGVYTYFHRAILNTVEAVRDANLNNHRARINIQWGQHGSLPVGWEKLKPEAIYPITGIKREVKTMQTRYQSAIKGRRLPDHPLGKDWPERFEESYKDYTTYDKNIDLRPLLQKKKMIIVSKWPNAVIDHYFLDYNFFPKIEFPGNTDK